MAQLSTMNQVFDIISQKNGIIGIYARPGMGKTTFMLQIVDEVNKRKDGMALVFSMAESQAQLIKRMQQINVSCDRVVIDDTPHPTEEYMETKIKQVGKVSILCIDYLQLLENAVVEKMTEIAKKYKIPILINGVLPRDFESDDQKVYLEQTAQQKYSLEYDFLALICQEEGCIGAEFIVKKCWHWDPINVIMEWDEKETKFQFEKDTEEWPMKQPPTSFDLRATQEYREMGSKIVNCPVCGKETLDDYFICPTCGWEYDGTIEENEYSSCNKATIVDYRKNNLK